MIRAACTVVVLAIATPAYAEDWSIRSPSDWMLAGSTSSRPTELTGPMRRYTSPDGRDELVVVKREISGVTPRSIVGDIIRDASADPAARVEKPVVAPHGDEIVGDVTLIAGDEIRRIRVIAAWDHQDSWTDVVYARCTMTKATAAVCTGALESLKLASKPAATVDTDNAFVKPALWILGAIVVLATIAIAFRDRLRRRATKRKTPLADGEIVTLTGTVRPVDPALAAPLSGAAGVAYQSRMYLLGAIDKAKVVVEACRFVIATPNGEVLVDSVPVFDLVPSPVVPRDEKRELAFMNRHGVPESRHRDAGFDEIVIAPHPNTVIHEIVIAPGATIVIRGLIAIDRDRAAAGERGYRDDAPTVTRLLGTEAKPVAIKKTW